MFKKLALLVLVLALVSTAFVGCSSSEPEAEAPATETPVADAEVGGYIGVAMPTKSLQRWNQDGSNMKAELEAEGFTVDLQYADNDVAKQVEQIENMITKEVDVLVIAAIDGGALSSVLAEAKSEGIEVIAYDRLIMDSDAVGYYATFDNYLVGVIQGQYIIDALDLENTSETFTMEVFAGSPDDNNAKFFNGGAMDTLAPYIEDGTLDIVSGQTEFSVIAIQGWASEGAQNRMDNLLTAYYSDSNIDVVLSPNDSLAQGITASLDSAGYGSSDKPFPILTGQDCDVNSTKNIIAGKQSMSIFKDTRTLATKVVEMVTAIVTGNEVPVNDTSTYNNNAKVVPSYLCEPVFADINNYEELLIDSGYYAAEDLQ